MDEAVVLFVLMFFASCAANSCTETRNQNLNPATNCVCQGAK